MTVLFEYICFEDGKEMCHVIILISIIQIKQLATTYKTVQGNHESMPS